MIMVIYLKIEFLDKLYVADKSFINDWKQSFFDNFVKCFWLANEHNNDLLEKY